MHSKQEDITWPTCINKLNPKFKAMKRTIILISLIAKFSNPAASQITECRNLYTVAGEKEMAIKYLEKGRSQKKIGSILLVSGVAVAGMGLLVNIHRVFGQGKEETYTYYYVGAGLAVLSVPFLIGAGQNKKAGELILRKESVQLAGIPPSKPDGFSMGIRINLHK